MKFHTILWLLLCLLPAACGGAETNGKSETQTSTESQAPADWTWIESNTGTFWAAWRTVQGPVEMGPSFAIEIRLAETRGGTPLDLPTGRVAVGARMPEHQHGMLQTVEVQALEPGHFRVDGMRFHMLGYWQLHLDVTRPPYTERAQFDIQL